MSFVPAALLLLFAITFFGVWRLERRQQHVRLFALSFGSFGFAILSQILHVPADAGLNALVSAALYVGGVLLFGDAVLWRSGQRLPMRFQFLTLLSLLGALGYFYYIDKSLLARVYVLNFGMGIALFYVAWRARFLRIGSGADRVLFWMVLLLACHFFPRTLLTATPFTDLDAADFAAATFWRGVLISLSMLGVAAGLGVLIVVGIDLIAALRWERDSDSLTGLLNRRGLEARAAIRAHGRRSTDRTSIVLCDIDRFKSINDKFGHGVGDVVLVGFAQLLRRVARHSDLVARLGGEEFVIVLHDCPVDQAGKLAERLRHTIQETPFTGLPPSSTVTCSFGVTELGPHDDLWSAIERADQYLYVAKREGRNQVVLDGTPGAR